MGKTITIGYKLKKGDELCKKLQLSRFLLLFYYFFLDHHIISSNFRTDPHPKHEKSLLHKLSTSFNSRRLGLPFRHFHYKLSFNFHNKSRHVLSTSSRKTLMLPC